MSGLPYGVVAPAPELSDFEVLAQHMLALMLRNVASDGFVFPDPVTPGRYSRPGCVIASPSYPADLVTVDQDYVFNWTRDAAITAIELAAAGGPTSQPLADYVNFAWTCQQAPAPNDRGCYTIEGEARAWSDQSDGPALRVIALLQAYPMLDPATQATAQAVLARDLSYVLGAYQSPTYNLWEEHSGYSFFARSVALRCLQEVAANSLGIAVPSSVAGAITWLRTAIGNHWDGQRYVSLLPAPPNPPPASGYDPNIDIVLAAVYGAVACTDTKLLATAAQLRAQWADSTSPTYYPINGADRGRGFGPMLGRYPADSYDGDVAQPVAGGHPWALCTCNFAELLYRVAHAIEQSATVPLDALSATFFGQIGVGESTSPSEAVVALRAAGDAMLRGVVFHSDHLELSEQFDGTTGFEKSVRNLTWSYAAFLSAVRARKEISWTAAVDGLRGSQQTGTPRPGTAQAQWAATNAMMNAQRLLVLDDVWTSTLQDAPRTPAADPTGAMATARQSAREMQVALLAAKQDARAMEAMLLDVDDATFEQALAAISAAQNAEPAGGPDIRDALGEAGSRAAAIAACREVQRDADSEAALLAQKLQALDQGVVPAGDLRLPFRCALTLVAGAAAAVSVIGLGGAPIFVALGVASGGWFVSRTWISDKCPMPRGVVGAAPASTAPNV